MIYAKTSTLMLISKAELGHFFASQDRLTSAGIAPAAVTRQQSQMAPNKRMQPNFGKRYSLASASDAGVRGISD
jgi:hypothetical protein